MYLLVWVDDESAWESGEYEIPLAVSDDIEELKCEAEEYTANKFNVALDSVVSTWSVENLPLVEGTRICGGARSSSRGRRIIGFVIYPIKYRKGE